MKHVNEILKDLYTTEGKGMKIGISIKIDVTKIDKARLFQGKKGKYLDLTTFIDVDEKNQYDDNGFISQSVSKEEKAQGVQTAILGNVKVFYNDTQTQPAQAAVEMGQPATAEQPDGFKDLEDIPF